MVTEEIKPQETLPCEPVNEEDLTREQLKNLCECKDNALKIAADTQEKLRVQLNEQIAMYNKDIAYMSELHSNTVKYSQKKEDYIKKILEGVIGLIDLDREPIVPNPKKEER